jgi:hypothetical protein
MFFPANQIQRCETGCTNVQQNRDANHLYVCATNKIHHQLFFLTDLRMVINFAKSDWNKCEKTYDFSTLRDKTIVLSLSLFAFPPEPSSIDRIRRRALLK